MARLPRDTSIPPGTRLGDFASYDVTVQQVASGGFGLVAFGPDRIHQGRMTALKTLHRLLLEDPDTTARFIEECLLWTGLWPHPNILLAYGVTQIGDAVSISRPFIGLEYAEHGSLRDLLLAAAQYPDQGGRLPLEIGLDIAQQIAAGLVYLHTPAPTYLRPEPTVHRDLKPENVLRLGDGRVAITDFGLAKVLTDSPHASALLALFSDEDEPAAHASAATRRVQTRYGQTLGTPAYMAPEQWVSAAQVGPAADIYAFAILLSELLAGRHALLDLDQPHAAHRWQEAHERLPTPSQPRGRPLLEVEPRLPMEVETLYQRALAVDPGARPSAAEVLATVQAAASTLGDEVYTPYERAPHTPENERVQWLRWGIAYYHFERYEQALLCNDQALKFDPHAADTLITRGNIFQVQQRWREAEQTYQQVLAEVPQDDTWHRAIVWSNLGTLYSQSSRYGEAEAAFEQALQLEPSKADTIYNRGANQWDWAGAEERAGHMEEAVQHLRLAREQAVTGIGLGYAPCQQLLTIIDNDLTRLQRT